MAVNGKCDQSSIQYHIIHLRIEYSRIQIHHYSNISMSITYIAGQIYRSMNKAKRRFKLVYHHSLGSQKWIVKKFHIA